MNGFLVVLRHSMDDIPLRLFATREEAAEFAKTVNEDDGEDEKVVLASDASTPISVFVYEFEQGRLISADMLKDFDEEEAKTADG